MDQGGRLQRLTRLFLRESLCRELAQFIVDQRQELLSGRRIALLDRGQDTGNVRHEGKHTARVQSSQHAGGRYVSRSPQGQSSFWMEPMPRFFENRALLLMPNRSRNKYSSASFLLSPMISIVMVFVVSPGAKVSVPDLAT